MATRVEFLPSIGSVWLRALALWEEYSLNIWQSWEFERNSTGSYKAYNVIVTNLFGVESTFTLVAMDLDVLQTAPLTYVVNAPGFRQQLGTAHPTTLPDGDDAVTAFAVGPKVMRADIFDWYSGISAVHEVSGVTSTRYGVALSYFTAIYQSDLMVVVDSVGIVAGALEGDSMTGYPTDLIGPQTAVAVSGAGGVTAAQFQQLVDATEDVATREVSYTANQGGAVWSMVGKVRTP